MEFDKSRVYTALNADELKVGSKVITGDTIEGLRNRVHNGTTPLTLSKIESDYNAKRFRVEEYDEIDSVYNFVYLLSEPEEKKLKWTDLKLGDVIRLIGTNRKVQVIGTNEDVADYHIYTCNSWMSDAELEEWEKVEE